MDKFFKSVDDYTECLQRRKSYGYTFGFAEKSRMGVFEIKSSSVFLGFLVVKITKAPNSFLLEKK